ncbi:hypothetical protein QYE77_08400 [Thermanaerothrix sp. 4228-RoL]|uniref:Uncharacterized protein n=1 Tax=Thermanaerothrix solaris TaxID=3058434 RepID=A0ABU3NN69_9CHLR|nr:hypothetical protein [Thermanaerothrix sp. 4228-RoL]MDT8898286.1 hypothetical protein [Thermanaerothrix sp. 4228-RoL]
MARFVPEPNRPIATGFNPRNHLQAFEPLRIWRRQAGLTDGEVTAFGPDTRQGITLALAALYQEGDTWTSGADVVHEIGVWD